MIYSFCMNADESLSRSPRWVDRLPEIEARHDLLIEVAGGEGSVLVRSYIWDVTALLSLVAEFRDRSETAERGVDHLTGRVRELMTENGELKAENAEFKAHPVMDCWCCGLLVREVLRG